jgi:class 3 adenylate cyclase
MNGQISTDHNKPWLRKYVWLLIVSWTVVISASVTWNLLNQNQSIREIALSEARAYFNKDQAFRLWATSHGGLYVPSDERTPPSPYLTHIPDRDIETASGIQLTLMNPAYAVRQLNEDFAQLYGVAGHITSLKPLRPENGPDDWERAALMAFNDGQKEMTQFTEVGGEPHLRLMGPLPTEEKCLKCHANEGYEVGDVIGGVGVSVPMTRLLTVKQQQAVVTVLGHGGLWLLGLLGIGLGTRQVSQRIKVEQQAVLLESENEILENLSAKLSKYLAPQVYSSIFTGKQKVEIASRRKKLTVFFSDIVGFTETTDNLEAEELSNLLNHYLTEMSKIALKYGATIDKYIGDAILIFFGDPESRGVKEDAKACVQMAIAMQRRMRELEEEWQDRGLERPLHIRIGINTGFCTVGNFGSQDRMDYTIIGNEVNLASRLESSAELGGILMAHETYSLVKDDILAEEQPPLTVKGFDKPIHCYKVVGIYGDLAGEGRIVRHQKRGIQVFVDFDKLTGDDRGEAVEVLKDALAKLED